MDKQTVGYTYNGIVFSHKKEQSTGVQYKLKLGGNLKTYANWKKLRQKVSYCMIPFIYVKRQIHKDGKQINVYQRVAWRGMRSDEWQSLFLGYQNLKELRN